MTKETPHVTVVGDLILDRYLIGDAAKLNPEQPGVVIRVDKEEDRLGGAAAITLAISTEADARHITANTNFLSSSDKSPQSATSTTTP